jgi:hypothetical protein
MNRDSERIPRNLLQGNLQSPTSFVEDTGNRGAEFMLINKLKISQINRLSTKRFEPQ